MDFTVYRLVVQYFRENPLTRLYVCLSICLSQAAIIQCLHVAETVLSAV